MKANNARPTGQSDGLARVFAVLFGVVLGLALLKFVNPAVFEKLVEWPTNGYEWVINPWPVVIGYWLLAVVALLGIFVLQRKIAAPRWLIVLPLLWLGWQFVAATHTVDAGLTRSTLKHFSACVVCFYLGLFSLAQLRDPVHFLWPICGGFLVLIAVGIQQHFGGLEESRQYFFTYVYPQTPSVPPEFLKKISSDRIFSTQFYPNALAGVLLLLLPATLVVIWQSKRWLTAAARTFLIGVVGLAALACLYWSGSKGGWLLMLVVGIAALLRLQFATRLKVVLVGVVLMAGLAGFALKYAEFFQRGATSVSARFDYWDAALRTTAANPLFGTGPGTFAIPYKQIKRPESEMARLTHNDYLQQLSDSGLVGFVFYVVFIVGALCFGKPSLGHAGSDQEILRFSIWLGLLGWSLQSLLEFGLYIPTLAWYSFACLGWLVGCTAKPIDKPQSADYSASHK
jgi:hypothetical protein